MDKVQTLSKGNAQKIQFIATLIHEPEFLILDEPFTGLDPVNTELLRNEIKRSRDKGSAVIFSNHNMSDVDTVLDIIKENILICIQLQKNTCTT